MKEADWNDCLKNYSSRSISPDRAKAKSLIRTAKSRIEYILKSKIDAKSANFVFESLYTSLIELMQALMQLEGFNVKNHICLGFYLRDAIEREDLFRIFDDSRFKRNSLIYYGKMMKYDIAKDAIEKCKKCIAEIQIILNKHFV